MIKGEEFKDRNQVSIIIFQIGWEQEFIEIR